MYSTETEIYSLATCPGTKYSGDTITLRATPRDGIGPYYVAFKKDGIIIDPSRLGGESNPITNAPENIEITRTYTLNDADVRNALTGNIDFSVFARGSCPNGGGLQFDGVDDYVIGSISLSSQEQTASARVFLPSAPNEKDGIIGFSGYKLHMWANPDGSFNFGAWTTYTNEEYTGLQTYSFGTWHFVVVVNKGATYTKLYVDGILDREVALTGNLNDLGTFWFGTHPAAPPLSMLTGSIDEVRIYNRALSPIEILELYNGSTPRNGLILEHIYSLGNANDLSGYGNNGTPINGPVFIPNVCMDTCTVAIGCIAPVCNFVVT